MVTAQTSQLRSTAAFLMTLFAATFWLLGRANAEPEEGQEPAAEAEDAIGINAELGVASHYMWRGANMFQEEKPSDVRLLLSPSLTWSRESFYVNYWGAFQLTGDNKDATMDGGYSAEQDLTLGYSYQLNEAFSLTGTAAIYWYPLAKEEAAGVDKPLYIEPTLRLTWTGPVDVSLGAAWYHAVQDEIKAGRHLYLNPTVSKALPIGPVELQATAGFGVKFFSEDRPSDDNRYDALLNIGAPIGLGFGAYIKPWVSASWTNWDDADYDPFVVFGGANLGIDL